ncbi:hypothetical protein F4780DRAFT_753830 [Xylariomycetidae sp. FL0641]|nr:hypothetical protein F4780DRAFT_753830 [Xylariomycetidae sp. FL0641]
MFSNTAQGQTILVTGAAGGLGKVIALSFLEAGANVAICDVSKERLQEVRDEWKSHDEKLLISETDITDEKAVDQFVQGAAKKFGRIDMLVNNAGVMDTFDPAGVLAKENWERVLGINLTGTFLCTKAAINAFEKQSPPTGTIISIGSVASYRGANAGAAYTVSKHGVVGLTKNTAAFYGPKGIFSLTLLMGAMDDTHINDSFARGFNAEGMKLLQDTSPGYVPGKTSVPLKDVAKYCLFFSDRNLAEASNGASITVNKNWPVA